MVYFCNTQRGPLHIFKSRNFPQQCNRKARKQLCTTHWKQCSVVRKLRRNEVSLRKCVQISNWSITMDGRENIKKKMEIYFKTVVESFLKFIHRCLFFHHICIHCTTYATSMCVCWPRNIWVTLVKQSEFIVPGAARQSTRWYLICIRKLLRLPKIIIKILV